MEKTLEQFEHEFKETVEPVNEENLHFENEEPAKEPAKEQTTEQAPNPTQPQTAAPRTMSLAQFSGVIVGAYTKLSDTIYIKIKKGIPPAWDNDTRALIVEALEPVLTQYNIPVTPITGLLGTLATIEFMRYTSLSNPQVNETKEDLRG